MLGKSGCGKTTLLKVISGLEERDAGEISFFDEAGRPVSSPKLSLVFQDPRLLPWKTVEENLSLAIRHLPEEERKQRIREVLELVRLPEVEALYPSELSGGMAQRVGLARGIIAKPDLLLVCLGCPKQEYWMYDNLDKLDVKLMAGLGGSLDVFAGVTQRAPEKWQKLGLEWLYRLIKEPSRIKRMIKLPAFIFAAVGQRIRGN